jgi:hypothetical protein
VTPPFWALDLSLPGGGHGEAIESPEPEPSVGEGGGLAPAAAQLAAPAAGATSVTDATASSFLPGWMSGVTDGVESGCGAVAL